MLESKEQAHKSSALLSHFQKVLRDSEISFRAAETNAQIAKDEVIIIVYKITNSTICV